MTRHVLAAVVCLFAGGPVASFTARQQQCRSLTLLAERAAAFAERNPGAADGDGNDARTIANDNSSSRSRSRRDVLRSAGAAAAAPALAFFASSLAPPGLRAADAAVTDETDAFATSADSAYSGLSRFDPKPSAAPQSQAAPSDEYTISIPKSALRPPAGSGLGIELADIQFRTNRRVYVKSVRPKSVADDLGIKKGWVLVSVDGTSAERTNAEGAAIMVSRSVRSDDGPAALELRFRDPAVFRDQLRDLSSSEGREVTTQVAPAGDTTQRNADGTVKRGEAVTAQTEQKLSVSQIVPPRVCTVGATTDDLLEISYIGTVLETGAVFDGSAIKVDGKPVPGRGNDVSLFFVLGKQPFGQFPPGWDVGLEGMCVGERRRLIIPPVLAYGATGVPRRGIPPNATLQYDITLVSINGLAVPR